MRKTILISATVVTAIGLVAFVGIKSDNSIAAQEASITSNESWGPVQFMDQSGTEIFMSIGSRFNATVKKADLHRATSILDFVPKEETAKLKSHANVKVVVMDNGLEIAELGANEMLNDAQLKLLRSTDYSTDFYINADSKRKHTEVWEHEKYDLVYYFTVVPEVEAIYSEGSDGLIRYIEDQTKELKSGMTEDELRAGKVRFTVSKSGEINQASLDASCGYESFDAAVINLIKTAPGKWTPAEDLKGEKVDQELVFSFGQVGC